MTESKYIKIPRHKVTEVAGGELWFEVLNNGDIFCHFEFDNTKKFTKDVYRQMLTRFQEVLIELNTQWRVTKVMAITTPDKIKIATMFGFMWTHEATDDDGNVYYIYQREFY